MRALLVLVLLGGAALVAYNYSQGLDPFQLPTQSAGDRVREKVGSAVRETVRDATRATGDEVKARTEAAARSAVTRAQDAVAEAALTSKIKAKMALDDLVKAADVHVESEGSTVTLTGDVSSAEERGRAVRIASETAGVTKVVDQLRLR